MLNVLHALLPHGNLHTHTQAALNRMVAELEAREDKKSKFSRRRSAANEPVTYVKQACLRVKTRNVALCVCSPYYYCLCRYINKRNRVFNKKVERAFDKYTQEIQQNLERGTAL